MRLLFNTLLAATVMLPWTFIAGACPSELIGPCAPWPEKSEEAAAALPRRESTNAEHKLLREVRAVGEVAIGDAAYLLTSPLRIDGKSALIVGGVAAGIGGLMAVDKTLQRAFQENCTETGIRLRIPKIRPGMPGPSWGRTLH